MFAALYCHTRRVEGGGSARKYKAVIDGVKLEQQNLDGIERSIVMFTVNNIIMSTFSASIDNCVVIILF